MNVLEDFARLNTFVFDIDGVLTDGQLLVLDNGSQVRRMNIKDGYALQWAVKQGYRIWVISGAKNDAARTRLHKLGIEEVYIGVTDKLALLQELMTRYEVAREQLLYMGDDIPDLECMHHAGLAACPADAAEDVLPVARYVSPYAGGMGCVRDVIRKTMLLHDKWAVSGKTLYPSSC